MLEALTKDAVFANVAVATLPSTLLPDTYEAVGELDPVLIVTASVVPSP